MYLIIKYDLAEIGSLFLVYESKLIAERVV